MRKKLEALLEIWDDRVRALAGREDPHDDGRASGYARCRDELRAALSALPEETDGEREHNLENDIRAFISAVREPVEGRSEAEAALPEKTDGEPDPTGALWEEYAVAKTAYITASCHACNSLDEKDAAIEVVAEARLDAAVQALARLRSPAPQDVVETVRLLRSAINIAAIQFRNYERLHLAKGTPEGDDKASRNADMAKMLESTLSDCALSPAPDEPAGLSGKKGDRDDWSDSRGWSRLVKEIYRKARVGPFDYPNPETGHRPDGFYNTVCEVALLCERALKRLPPPAGEEP